MYVGKTSRSSEILVFTRKHLCYFILFKKPLEKVQIVWSYVFSKSSKHAEKFGISKAKCQTASKQAICLAHGYAIRLKACLRNCFCTTAVNFLDTNWLLPRVSVEKLRVGDWHWTEPFSATPGRFFLKPCFAEVPSVCASIELSKAVPVYN